LSLEKIIIEIELTKQTKNGFSFRKKEINKMNTKSNRACKLKAGNRICTQQNKRL